MDFTARGMTDVKDILTPKAKGTPVNTHVVPPRPSREPDFEKMNRLVRNESHPPVDKTPDQSRSK